MLTIPAKKLRHKGPRKSVSGYMCLSDHGRGRCVNWSSVVQMGIEGPVAQPKLGGWYRSYSVRNVTAFVRRVYCMITITCCNSWKATSMGSLRAREVCSLSRGWTTQSSPSDGFPDLTVELQLGAELCFGLMKELLFRACSPGNGCKTPEEQDADLSSASCLTN